MTSSWSVCVSRTVLVVALLAVVTSPAVAQRAAPDGVCTPLAAGDPSNAADVLRRAWSVMRVPERGRVFHAQIMQEQSQNYQSDRPAYPPYFSAMSAVERWFDPATGAERVTTRALFPGTGPTPARTTLGSSAATLFVRDTALTAVGPLHTPAQNDRRLDPWAVIHDWIATGDARLTGRCRDQDFPRLTLVRTVNGRAERLFVDPKSGFPTKLVRTEPHYLWGQVDVEYRWTTWTEAGTAFYPGSSFRIVDGDIDVSRTTGQMELIAADSAPRLTLPAGTAAMTDELPIFLQALPPDTVRAGTAAFLLVNRGYAEAVALVRDTVFVFDATQSEQRARQDSVWIGKLFPGKHPVVLVVTDLAWPHIAGIRFWVASGATVVSHRNAEPFLRRVVSRTWTFAPDILERRRRPLRFQPVDGRLSRAGGGVEIRAIDGIGSEAALLAFLPGERFLWASDYVQQVQAPTLYAHEVWSAVRREQFAPERVAAQHIKLTPWATVAALVSGEGAQSSP